MFDFSLSLLWSTSYEAVIFHNQLQKLPSKGKRRRARSRLSGTVAERVERHLGDVMLIISIK